MAEVAAARTGPILKGPTRLEEKVVKMKADEKAWEACKRTVDVRDHYNCRHCGCKTVKTLDLTPNRAEHHHIVRRKKEAKLLTDPRNVLLLCHVCHTEVTRRKLFILQPAKAMFTLNGKSYLNADNPVEWKR